MNNFLPRVHYGKFELQEKLLHEEYVCTQMPLSEPANTGRYQNTFDDGKYNCIVCDYELFDSKHKFRDYGWPAFSKVIGDTIEKPYTENGSEDTISLKVYCKNCAAHLGDAFQDPEIPGRKRYFVNSFSLKFMPSQKVEPVEQENIE